MRKNGKMRKILILLLCFVFFIGLSGSVSAAIPSGDACEVVVDSDGDEIPDDAKKAEILKHAYRIQVPFIENRGQVESKDVRFYANTFGGTIFVEKDGVLTYNLPVEDKGGVVIKEIFTEKQITITGLEPSPTRVNYFIGKDKSNWKTNIPSYDSIPLGEIYKGIDLTLRAYGNNVEKLFTVLPEENPEIIRIKIEGAKGLKVNEKGELEVITELGTVRFTKPLAYQKIGGKKETVEVTYVSYKENTYGFKVGNYDKKRPLIIDPLLASTFIGGGVGDNDYGRSIAIDATGNVYVTGETHSSDYPTTSGAYDESHNGYCDVFVSRLDSTLSTLLASTFIGGGSADYVYSIAIDESGNVYVTGYTDSSDYPTTPGAYDESHNGYYDVFVSKLDMSLSSLLSSTFIGGGDRDEGYSIALDGSGNVYVTGDTHSSDYPTTSGAYDESFNGAYDVFVSKLDSSLSTLLSSTFIGGGEDDVGYSIAIDGSGNVYVTGLTSSSDYSTTSGAYDRSFNGYLYDVFISKLDSSLSSLLASTFIGGGSADYAYSIALDETGNVYVTGLTYSSDYPITSGAYDESHNGYYDVFVSKLDRDLSRPEYVQDSDGDGVPDDQDGCPNDPNKIEPGICGCGVADTDSDGDGTADCNDGCPNDPNKIELGVCGCGVADTDSDGDGTADCNDNCPSDPNSDQGNVDSDEYGDVCDICPDDFTNTCNPDRSAGVSIGADGGTISTPDGSVTIIVPSGAVGDDTSLSITETGTSYELTTNLGKGIALFGVSIQPEGLVFNTPVTIIFAWLDEYDDGKVDGTNIQERKLIITKDNVAITGRCGQDFGCDMAENKFTFAVLGLSEFALVFVDDEGPITSNVLADPNPVSVNTEITLTATVDDSQTGESTIGSAEYNIDGGDYIQMDAQDGNFDSVSEDVEIIIPAFAEPGVYSICVRGWDIFENIEGAEDCILLAVYDPTGGFVTGGGWINSPEGAYTPDPSLTGKANFGFVSKYKKGATVPTGHTEFQFKVADLNFHSDAYDWLVIAGAKARYKGTGTINGEGNYGFMLSAIDEELTPSTDDDLFRIKIWDTENNDAVVYDNQMGDAGDAELTTEVQGGSIKIHKDK